MAHPRVACGTTENRESRAEALAMVGTRLGPSGGQRNSPNTSSESTKRLEIQGTQGSGREDGKLDDQKKVGVEEHQDGQGGIWTGEQKTRAVVAML